MRDWDRYRIDACMFIRLRNKAPLRLAELEQGDSGPTRQSRQRSMQGMLINAVKIALCVTPMLVCMYLLFWMSSQQVWDAQTPFRDVLTGGIVASGMLSAYLLLSRFVLRSK